MSNNDKANCYNALKVSKFDHSSTTPRATRWREWVVKLRYAFGSAYPLLANQTSEVLDPLKYWWGLTWNPLLDFDNFNPEQEQKLYVDFQKAQYSLLHVLSEKFGTLEKQIIALEFFPDKPGWTPTHWITTWLSFGYMCMQAIAAKYDDSGVTDASLNILLTYLQKRSLLPTSSSGSLL